MEVMSAADKKTVTSVTLTAIDNGSSLTLMDVFGKRIATVQKHCAMQIPAAIEGQIQKHLDWQEAFVRCSRQHHGRLKRKNLSGWEKQAHVWHRSLRWRRNRLKSQDQSHSPRAARPVSAHASWREACFALRKVYVQKLCNERRRKKNHWRLWAETIYSNLRKRKDIHEQRKQRGRVSDDQAISLNTGTTGRQMCIEWHSDYTSDVLA
jgi:hypothetical protein